MPTTTKMTDAEVIERSKADGDAFVELFHRHFDAIHRYVARRAGRDAADEVSAETFVQAFRSRHNYTSTSDSALPWLYATARRCSCWRGPISPTPRSPRQRPSPSGRCARGSIVPAASSGPPWVTTTS